MSGFHELAADAYAHAARNDAKRALARNPPVDRTILARGGGLEIDRRAHDYD
jgi:hypothetical protein